jgi:hypothetical protein
MEGLKVGRYAFWRYEVKSRWQLRLAALVASIRWEAVELIDRRWWWVVLVVVVLVVVVGGETNKRGTQASSRCGLYCGATRAVNGGVT